MRKPTKEDIIAELADRSLFEKPNLKKYSTDELIEMLEEIAKGDDGKR